MPQCREKDSDHIVSSCYHNQSGRGHYLPSGGQRNESALRLTQVRVSYEPTLRIQSEKKGQGTGCHSGSGMPQLVYATSKITLWPAMT